MKTLCDCLHYKFFSTFGLRRPVGILYVLAATQKSPPTHWHRRTESVAATALTILLSEG